MEVENIDDSEIIKKQIEELKTKLRLAKKTKKEEKPVKEIKVKKVKKTREEKQEYMRNYMRNYQKKNKEAELARRNTCYYLKKYDISDDFKNEFKIHTADAWKAIETMKRIKKNSPELYPLIFKYI